MSRAYLLKRIGFAGLVLSLALSAPAGYVADRRAAVALAQAGKHAEALAAFSNLAVRAGSDLQKSDALEQAVLRAGILRQYDLALELAQRIPLPAVARQCRMRLLNETNKDRELIAEFQDEAIDQWPESAVGAGSLHRGRAHYRLKNGKAAEADLRRATAYLGEATERAAAWLALGDNYRDNLNDESQALAAYRKTQETLRGGWGYINLTALVSQCGILNRQGRQAEALAALAQVDLGRMGGHWKGVLLHTQGESLAGLGRKDEAVAKFAEAIAVPDLPASVKSFYEKKLQEYRAGTTP